MVAGFDTSMSSIAGAAIGYDATTKNFKGPVFTEVRWQKGDHYFERIKAAAKGHDFIHDLMHVLGVMLNPNEVWIAQEEPWPVGMAGRGASSFMKQQAEISGALLGGWLRYGWQNIEQMNSMRWRTTLADELGITTHHSKWRSPELAAQYNCKPKDSGKFRTKQWAISPMTGLDPDVWQGEIPVWPDIIEGSKGKIPRPEGSVAKAVQPDDRYDALAVMYAHYRELLAEGIFDKSTQV